MAPERVHPRTLQTRWIAALALALAVPALGASNCTGDDLIRLTVNAVPEAEAELLVLPPSGFTVDITFPDPSAVIPSTLVVVELAWAAPVPQLLTGDIVAWRPDGAVILVPPEHALEPGSHTFIAGAERVIDGEQTVALLSVAVREHVIGAPLQEWQWVQLDPTSDLDGDGEVDLRADLRAFGLASLADPALADLVYWRVVGEIVGRVQQLYHASNPSGLPGGDPVWVRFSGVPPPSGRYTRICIGGASPGAGGVIGNVRYDPANGDPADVACDLLVPSGVFPRELLRYAWQPAFQTVFDPLLAAPVGTDPLDAQVLGVAYDPSDPVQLARREEIDAGIAAFAQAVATVTAHETGHALGLVPPGTPGGGLYGGTSGPDFTHNVTPYGGVPPETFLMNAGASFAFAELAGLGGVPLPRLRALNHAYLHGRLVLDDAVRGIYGPPKVDSVEPAEISLLGPDIISITVQGTRFIATPTVRLVGPNIHAILGEELESPTRVVGLALLPQLAEGVYDLELRNPDGQLAVLPAAVQVR